ncbi:MAG: hypothetical protein ACXACU_03600, partial [Candidatus Hodarchaeales archaeon]
METNSDLPYEGVELLSKEVSVLKIFQKILGKPIPEFRDLKSEEIGFTSENHTIIRLKIINQNVMNLPDS